MTGTLTAVCKDRNSQNWIVREGFQAVTAHVAEGTNRHRPICHGGLSDCGVPAVAEKSSKVSLAKPGCRIESATKGSER